MSSLEELRATRHTASSAVRIPSTPWSRYSDGSLNLGGLTNRSLQSAINSALMAMLCDESRPIEELNMRLGFGWGNQLGIVTSGVYAAAVDRGHRVNTTSVFLGKSGITLAGHTPHGLMINNASRCDTDNLACMFMDVNEQCALRRRDDAASNSSHHRRHELVSSLVDSKLKRTYPYLAGAEAMRIVARPNARLRAHVHHVVQAVGRPHVSIHVRRGDRLTVTNGHDFIRAYPTSVLAELVRNATGAVPALVGAAATAAAATRPRVLVLSDDADVPDDLAYLLPEVDVHTLQIGDTLGEPLGKPALDMVKSWRLHGREQRDGGGRRNTGDAAAAPCGMPAAHGQPALPRCRPADAPESAPRARVHRFGADEMGPADFLFASAMAMARACVMILSVRSGYSMQMWTLAAAHHSCEGTPHVIDLDGELSVSRLAMGYWQCGNRMLCPGPGATGARAVHVCKSAAERCNRRFPQVV